MRRAEPVRQGGGGGAACGGGGAPSDAGRGRARAHEEAEAETGPAPAPQQLTISYGGRVVVLEDVPADRAAKLLRVAAAAQGPAPRALAAGDLPVARKASLQRFMEKRRGRTAARGSPYSRPDADGASPHPDHLALAL